MQIGMSTKKLFFLFIFCFFCTISKGQVLDELIGLHKENLINLYQSRGAPADWVTTGNVTESDLVNALKEYKNNVGLMIYTHQNDTLYIVVLNKQGQKVQRNIPYTKDNLVGDVNCVNYKFSKQYLAKATHKRMIEIMELGEDTIDPEKKYTELNLKLLPYREEIRKFDHLIIVPTLNLATLPFAAFKLTDSIYFIDELSYSIAPSLFELMVSREVKYRAGFDGEGALRYNFKNALFVTNPTYSKNAPWPFPDLPGTLKEVNYISQSFDNNSYTKLVGKEASKKNIKPNLCEYDLLYFATHGISNSENPLEKSFLVLAGEGQEGYLTAKEIQDIRYTCQLNAHIVVLSACQTGLGKEHESGIIGLSRAFQIAGANHVVMSLWSINDEETAILMSFFFDFLKQGGHMMPHEALRMAMLKYKNGVNNNPNYWASFSIFGIPY